MRYYLFFFFFQAEDGIRYVAVTGVQTCALPISVRGSDSRAATVGAPRGYSRTDRLFHGSDFARDRPAETPDRPGCDGGIAVTRLAWKRPAASQQCRARHDPRGRRPGSDHHG